MSVRICLRPPTRSGKDQTNLFVADSETKPFLTRSLDVQQRLGDASRIPLTRHAFSPMSRSRSASSGGCVNTSRPTTSPRREIRRWWGWNHW